MTEIQIELYCAACGGPLEAKWDALRQKLEVELCEDCIDGAVSRAVETDVSSLEEDGVL